MTPSPDTELKPDSDTNVTIKGAAQTEPSSISPTENTEEIELLEKLRSIRIRRIATSGELPKVVFYESDLLELIQSYSSQQVLQALSKAREAIDAFQDIDDAISALEDLEKQYKEEV